MSRSSAVVRSGLCAIAVALSAVAVGCSGSGGDGGSAGASDSSDGDTAGGGFVDGSGAAPDSDGASGTPDVADTGGRAPDASPGGQAEPECTSDGDCAGDLVCDCHGSCQAPGEIPCTEDKNCGGGKWCDACWGFCRPLVGLCEPCSSEAECEGAGTACLDFASGGRFCSKGCLAVAGCPPGFTCEAVAGVESDQCLPSSGDCSAPGECGEDSDCEFPLICNQDLLVCAEGCSDDEDCAADLVCTAGRCKEPCDEATNPCEEGQECVDGHCRVPGGCLSPADCLEPETHCDLETLMCVPGCVSDFDCKSSALVCQQGACVAKACPGNYACAFGQVCSSQSGKCEAAEGPYCEVCNPDDDTSCSAQNPENLCASFQDEDGNELGSFCLVECGSDPANPCPQGYQCTELEVAEGDVRSLCTRACYIAPIGSP